ncbi:hypothetical protein F442_04022 [Phytophthora nicotianae P10297]|uniref:PH domain-containing protein n=1 Tax=Phytophthora nicotianae P10297 TaxID=1317064 RepID=W2ZWZ9_PHYNI|nr:hypothetical protein F442_04022 [Phytophthora nicotianae P10297]
MKATTCVRVVLPTDELVRMECTATMTVADLVKTLEKRASFQKTNGIDRNGESGYDSYGNNNCDNDPATETTLGCRSKGFSRGTLTLVRVESELKAQALVVDQVEELDILEFQIASIDTPEWIAELSFRQSRRISPIINSSPHNIVGAVRPASTTLIPLCQMKQVRAVRDEERTNQDFAETTGFKHHPVVKCKDLIQHSNVIRSRLRRHRARRRLTSRIGGKRLLFTQFQKLRSDAKERKYTGKYTERVLLGAGMQLINLIHLVHMDVRGLVFLLRDAILGGHTLSMCEILSLVRTMVTTLTYINFGSSAATSLSEDDNESLVRRLSWDIAGKDGGVTVIQEGWVVSAEWGAFWRSQRKEYACLCDNHVLYFFSSRTHCADFVFELGRDRDGSISDTSKRLLKVNSPLSQIDLSETDWSVRKSIQEEDSTKLHRNAFAFFDANGRMRLVLDVSSGAEATLWVRLISAEMSQSKLFARMRELNNEPAKSESEDLKIAANPLATWTEILTQCSTSIDNQQSLIIPLYSLYSQIDRRSGTARAERYKSWTLGQALKDLQRDCVKINGLVLAGASLEANILALTLEILKCTEERRETSMKARGTATSLSVNVKEMTALRFARQVIIYSSRTHGGGDILDALHLLFGNEKYCICPDAHSMEPIEINVSKEEVPLSAQISMKMTYRVIPTDSIGPMEEQGDSVLQYGEAERQLTEFKIVGTYSQRVSCHFIEGNDIEGSVQLQAAG